MTGRITNIELKVERAKEHIRNLQVEVAAFLRTSPYVIGTRKNPQTGQLIYYLTTVKEVTPRIAVICGDALQNLRSALDHLAWRLVEANGRTPTAHTAFPIYDDSAKYEAGSPGQVKGMSNAAIEAIDFLKPYKGGNDTLWRLHKLNNIDKHRFVIAVGSAFRSVDLGGHLFGKMIEMFPDLADAKPVQAFFTPGDRMFPLKVGDELFVDAPDAKVNEKLQFLFDIAFGEPQIIEGDPLLETLREFADVVDNLIRAFTPLL